MSEDSTPYTPTPSDVREAWIESQDCTFGCGPDQHGAEFDRMIAKVKVDALREAHADLQAYTDAGAPFGHRPVEEFLLNRAEGIETGGAE